MRDGDGWGTPGQSLRRPRGGDEIDKAGTADNGGDVVAGRGERGEQGVGEEEEDGVEERVVVQDGVRQRLRRRVGAELVLELSTDLGRELADALDPGVGDRRAALGDEAVMEKQIRSEVSDAKGGEAWETWRHLLPDGAMLLVRLSVPKKGRAQPRSSHTQVRVERAHGRSRRPSKTKSS